MIPLKIQRTEFGWRCVSDEHHHALAWWLEEVGCGSDVAVEMFTDFGALLAGSKEQVDVWINDQRATVELDRVRFQRMIPTGPFATLEISFDELVDAVLRWFDVVNSEVASELRTIQATWTKPSW